MHKIAPCSGLGNSFPVSIPILLLRQRPLSTQTASGHIYLCTLAKLARVDCALQMYTLSSNLNKSEVPDIFARNSTITIENQSWSGGSVGFELAALIYTSLLSAVRNGRKLFTRRFLFLWHCRLLVANSSQKVSLTPTLYKSTENNCYTRFEKATFVYY